MAGEEKDGEGSGEGREDQMGRSGTKPGRAGVKRRGKKSVIKERRGMKKQSNTGEGKKGVDK